MNPDHMIQKSKSILEAIPKTTESITKPQEHVIIHHPGLCEWLLSLRRTVSSHALTMYSTTFSYIGSDFTTEHILSYHDFEQWCIHAGDVLHRLGNGVQIGSHIPDAVSMAHLVSDIGIPLTDGLVNTHDNPFHVLANSVVNDRLHMVYHHITKHTDLNTAGWVVRENWSYATISLLAIIDLLLRIEDICNWMETINSQDRYDHTTLDPMCMWVGATNTILPGILLVITDIVHAMHTVCTSNCNFSN